MTYTVIGRIQYGMLTFLTELSGTSAAWNLDYNHQFTKDAWK